MDDSSIDAGLDAPADNKLPLGLAIAAIALGGFALIFAFTAKNKVSRLCESVNIEVTELNDRVEKALAEVRANGGDTQKLDAISADIDSFKAQVQTNFQSVTVSYQNLAATVESMKNGRTQQVASQPQRNPAAGGSGTPAPAGSGEYTVKSGDSLWKIATAHGCSVDTLKQLNPGINPDKLTIGKKIKVPAKR